MRKCAIPVISYASGIAAGDPDCSEGPSHIQAYLESCKDVQVLLDWQEKISPSNAKLHGREALPEVIRMSEALAVQTAQCVRANEAFLGLGGDHSSAIGIWSGALHALDTPMGLLWVDAHLDGHTFETSPSFNIHGMPLAALLGYGDAGLTQIASPKHILDPKAVVVFGVRSYEKGEWALFEDLGVTVFTMEKIKKMGLDAALQAAYNTLCDSYPALGITIDLDGFDPEEVPSVGTPVPDGIPTQAFINTLSGLLRRLPKNSKIKKPRLIGIEITEYNPRLDKGDKGAQTVKRMIEGFFS